MPDSNLHKLSALGQSVWLDYLSREILQTGKLERMMREDAVVGVTSNPTIFQKALAEGDRYDDLLRESLDSGETDPKELFLQLSSHDVAEACDLMRKVWDEGEGLDGYVSWEVDPTLAYDRDGTVAQAKRLHDWIDRPNLYVKIPATKLKGKLAIANAKIAYQNYLEIFSGARWDALEQKGATKQRCLWASTSTKNPEYRDVMYVEELIGPDTVNTMPEETIVAFQDHGKAAQTLTHGIDEAHKVLGDLRAAGIDYDDVTETLEREGVQKFTDSLDSLKEGIQAKRGELAPA